MWYWRRERIAGNVLTLCNFFVTLWDLIFTFDDNCCSFYYSSEKLKRKHCFKLLLVSMIASYLNKTTSEPYNLPLWLYIANQVIWKDNECVTWECKFLILNALAEHSRRLNTLDTDIFHDYKITLILCFFFFNVQLCSSIWLILMLKGRIMFMFIGLWAPQDLTTASVQQMWVLWV